MTDLSVRAFAPADRAAVHDIAADTAFFGAPAEAFIDDRRTYSDVFYTYYTDLEAEHGWVACADQQVVGFLMGCTDTTRQQAWMARSVVAGLWRAVLGRYRLGRRTWRYTWGLALASLRGDWAHADLEQYPAHLHINVAAPWRGRGLGRRLIEAYLGQLRRLGLPGVHLETTNLNEAACRLYERCGFHLLDARPTRLWAYLVPQAVENRTYGLLLR